MRVEASLSPWIMNDATFFRDPRIGWSSAPEERRQAPLPGAAETSVPLEAPSASDAKSPARETEKVPPLSGQGKDDAGFSAPPQKGLDGLKALEEERIKKRLGLEPCQTCENRRYQDDSDDPSVSFQVPTKMTPQEAALAVPAHEGEHVHNEQARADREGRRVISQSVRIHTSVCPECGRVYVSGGTTTTVTAAEVPRANSSVGQNDTSSLDLVA